MIIRILLELEGELFSPKKFIENVGDLAFVNFYSHEKEDIIDQGRNESFNYGCLSILNPRLYGAENNMKEYQYWYLKFIEENYEIMVSTGLTEIRLFWDVFFSDQCNFEIFDKVVLSKLAEYNVAIPISVRE